MIGLPRYAVYILAGGQTSLEGSYSLEADALRAFESKAKDGGCLLLDGNRVMRYQPEKPYGSGSG